MYGIRPKNHKLFSIRAFSCYDRIDSDHLRILGQFFFALQINRGDLYIVILIENLKRKYWPNGWTNKTVYIWSINLVKTVCLCECKCNRSQFFQNGKMYFRFMFIIIFWTQSNFFEMLQNWVVPFRALNKWTKSCKWAEF